MSLIYRAGCCAWAAIHNANTHQVANRSAEYFILGIEMGTTALFEVRDINWEPNPHEESSERLR